MNRRTFLAAVSSVAFAGTSRGQQVRVAVDVSRRFGMIPQDFVGFGYEISSVSLPGFLSARNRSYVQLVKTLSPEGIMRVGGNTSDDARFDPTGKAVASPKGTVVNTAGLSELGTFLEATNWRLIWGLNLGSTDERQAIAEANAVATAAKDRLLAFEIGNEPDLFGRGTAHRPADYNYDAFLQEYRRYKKAIRASLPEASFAGPDAASATDWVTRFATDEGTDLKLLTHHYYRECQSPASTLDKLLHPDPKLARQLAALRAASSTSRVPYRICETNSFCGGGRPGVSDTFGAALWVLDFMFTLAYAGCAGVNIETGVNQLGFVSSYSPIRNEEGTASPMPEYYGMLAFTRASQGDAVAVDCAAGATNITAYAVADQHAGLTVTLINKDSSIDANVTLALPKEFTHGQVLRLMAPSLESKSDVTFGGASVAANGTWKAERTEIFTGGNSPIHVPAASAAVLHFSN